MFVEDVNTILAEPMKSKSEQETKSAIVNLHTYLTNRGFNPRMKILDNECPSALKSYFLSNNITFQLVPPHLYRTNKAENATSTFKGHLIAGLSSVYPFSQCTCGADSLPSLPPNSTSSDHLRSIHAFTPNHSSTELSTITPHHLRLPAPRL